MSNHVLTGIPSDLLSKEKEYGRRRIKIQGLTINQQYIIDGLGFSTTWRENSIAAAGGEASSEFTVPSGYYMALDLRVLNPEFMSFKYKVFPEGTYTLGTAKVDDGDSFAKTRNLRQDSTFISQWLARYNVITEPSPTDFIIYEDIFGAEVSGSRSSSTLSAQSSFLLLSPDQKFLLKMINEGVEPMQSVVQLEYAFIPESLMTPPVI